MTTGIGASLTTVTAGTTIRAADAMANWNAINNAGVSNDGGAITTGSGALTAVSVSNSNGVIHGTTMLTSPYLLRNNSTLNSGSSATYTCTGVGTPTIPSGIKAVWLNIFYTPSAAGTYVTATPHGTSWSAGLHPIVGTSANGTNIVCGQVLVAVDGSGQIDVVAGGGNAVGLYVGIYAYLY